MKFFTKLLMVTFLLTLLIVPSAPVHAARTRTLKLTEKQINRMVRAYVGSLPRYIKKVFVGVKEGEVALVVDVNVQGRGIVTVVETFRAGVIDGRIHTELLGVTVNDQVVPGDVLSQISGNAQIEPTLDKGIDKALIAQLGRRYKVTSLTITKDTITIVATI